MRFSSIFLVFTLVCSNTINAEVTQISVNSVSLNATLRDGPFSAKSITFVENGKKHDYLNLSGKVSLFHNQLEIKWADEKLSVGHNLGDQVDKLSKFQLENLSSIIRPGTSELLIPRLYVETVDQEFTALTQLRANCYNNKPTVEISTMMVMESCWVFGTIHVDRFEIRQSSLEIKKFFEDEGLFGGGDDQQGEISYLDLRAIDMAIQAGRFSLDAVVKSFMNSKFKMEGDIYIHKQTNQVVIKVEKAKVGIVDLKNTILKKIAEAKLSRIAIDGDRIIIFVGPSLY